MNEIKNIFKNKKILTFSVVFIILSLFHIIYASLTQRGLVSDGQIWVAEILDNLSFDKWYFKFIFGVRTRGFINFINQMPINMGYMFFHINSKYWLSVLFSVPLFLFPFLVLFWQFSLAKRTKRFDIFVLSMALYCLFILPGIPYAAVEVFLASSVMFLLFHYLSADISYTKGDIVLIFLLCFLLYDSSEAEIYYGIILFFASLFYAAKTQFSRSKAVKYFIGINGLLSSVVVFLVSVISLGNRFYTESLRFFLELTPSFFDNSRNYLKEPVIFLMFTLLIIAFNIYRYYRHNNTYKELNNKYLIFLLLSYSGLLIYMYLDLYTFFNSSAHNTYRVFPFIILPLISLIILFIDYFNKNIALLFWKNMLLIILIAGSVNTIIQYAYTFYFANFTQKLTKELIHSNKSFLNPDTDLKQLYNGKDNVFFYCGSYVTDSLIFAPEYKIHTVVIPSEKINKDCPQMFLFTKDKKYFVDSFYNKFHVKNKFWDLEPVLKDLPEDNILFADTEMRKKLKTILGDEIY